MKKQSSSAPNSSNSTSTSNSNSNSNSNQPERPDVPLTPDPSFALEELLSPDGYYTYLQIPVPKQHQQPPSFEKESINPVDTDLVQKNYRRLSLKHHPDRRGGDTETFRFLNRAKKVLITEKLRKQYDLLGLDLEDDLGEGETEEKTQGSSEKTTDENDADANPGANNAESVVGQLASATLTTILQIIVRTGMMCGLSTFLCRFKTLVLPIVLFLCFVAWRVKSTPGTTRQEIMVPVFMATGVILMLVGRIRMTVEEGSPSFSYFFWLGETFTFTTFLQTSLPPNNKTTPYILFLPASIVAFIMRGRIWRYAVVLVFQVVLGLLAVLAFPIMEMILEEIMKDKLRKVGEKIRQWKKIQNELRNKK